MSGNFVNHNCRVIPLRITTAGSNITILTATGYMQIIGVRICNGSAGISTVIHLDFVPAAGGSFLIQANRNMQPGDALWFPLEGFSLKEGDKLRVFSTTAATLDVLTSVAEVPGRTA